MNIKVTKPRLSLPHARDIEIIQGDRNVNILEIGSNTRATTEHSELKFAAEDEGEPVPPGPAPATGAIAEPEVEEISHPGDHGGLSDLSTSQQSDFQSLFDKPTLFVGRTVIKNFGEPHGNCIGMIVDCDEDNSGNNIWGIQFGDGYYCDFDINQMRKYSILMSDGATGKKPWMDCFISDIPEVKARLDRLHVAYVLTDDNDTWFDTTRSLSLFALAS